MKEWKKNEGGRGRGRERERELDKSTFRKRDNGPSEQHTVKSCLRSTLKEQISGLSGIAISVNILMEDF